MSFFNTIGEQGLTLQEHRATALSQQQVIHEHFKAHPNRPFTVHQLQEKFNLFHPISVQRSVAVLYSQRHIIKTSQIPGPYGKLVWLYQLYKA